MQTNCLPSLVNVPEKVKEWAQKIGDMLTPAQMDYLVAIFIVRQHPVVRHKALEGNAFNVMFQYLKKTQPLYFTGWPDFKNFSEIEMQSAWELIKDQVWADLPSDIADHHKKIYFEGLRKIFMERSIREDAWDMFFLYHPHNLLVKMLFSEYWRNDEVGIRACIIPGNEDSTGQYRPVLFPVPPEIAATFIKASVRKLARMELHNLRKCFRLSQKKCRSHGRQTPAEKLGALAPMRTNARSVPIAASWYPKRRKHARSATACYDPASARNSALTCFQFLLFSR